jgi:hypothetical protein
VSTSGLLAARGARSSPASSRLERASSASISAISCASASACPVSSASPPSLPEFLRFAESYYLMIYAGLVIVLMVYCPTGLIGLIEKTMTAFKAKRIEIGRSDCRCHRALRRGIQSFSPPSFVRVP